MIIKMLLIYISILGITTYLIGITNIAIALQMFGIAALLGAPTILLLLNTNIFEEE